MNIEQTIANLLFTGGTALAGLVLVFLGMIINAFESYDSTQKSAVVSRYKKRAHWSLSGFPAIHLVRCFSASVCNLPNSVFRIFKRELHLYYH